MKCLIRCDFPVYNYFFFSMPVIIEMCSWPLVEGELFERAHYLLSMNIKYLVLHCQISSSLCDCLVSFISCCFTQLVVCFMELMLFIS